MQDLGPCWSCNWSCWARRKSWSELGSWSLLSLARFCCLKLVSALWAVVLSLKWRSCRNIGGCRWSCGRAGNARLATGVRFVYLLTLWMPSWSGYPRSNFCFDFEFELLVIRYFCYITSSVGKKGTARKLLLPAAGNYKWFVAGGLERRGVQSPCIHGEVGQQAQGVR